LKNGLNNLTFDEMKLLDLYGFAAMMLHAFFKVKYAESGHIEIKNFNYDLRDCYHGEVSRDELSKMETLIKNIMDIIVADNVKVDVSDIINCDKWFAQVRIDKSCRYSHIT